MRRLRVDQRIIAHEWQTEILLERAGFHMDVRIDWYRELDTYETVFEQRTIQEIVPKNWCLVRMS